MPPVIHECPDCGLFSQLSAPVAGTDMCCTRCDKILRRVRRDPLNSALACALAGLICYLLALSAPFLQVMLYGRFRSSTLATGPMNLDDQGLWALGTVVLMVTILMPLVKLLGVAYVLIGMRLRNPPRHLPFIFGALKHIAPWAMTEVYLLGFMVAYTRLQAIMYVSMGMGVYALVGLMLASVAMDAALDPESVWEEMQRRGLVNDHPHATPETKGHMIGCENCHLVSEARNSDTCPRCEDILYDRKPGSIARSWSLMITAAILYAPSNVFPIMTVVRFGKVQNYTIFGGIQELMHIGLWPLALLVFVASIFIPMFKLIVLGYTLIQTQRGVTHDLRMRTRFYRVIDFIGRWSMVDVFMVSILVALVRFGQLAEITANVGVAFFASVVILTMLAVEGFDPRLMWDKARITGKRQEIPALKASEPLSA